MADAIPAMSQPDVQVALGPEEINEQLELFPQPPPAPATFEPERDVARRTQGLHDPRDWVQTTVERNGMTITS